MLYNKQLLCTPIWLRNTILGVAGHSTSSTSSTTTSANNKLDLAKWRLEVALFIYRPPLIAPPLTEAEAQFTELSEAADHRASYKCDYELQMEKDTKLEEKRRQLEAEGKDLSALNEQLGISSLQHCKDWGERAEQLTQEYGLLEAPQTFAEEDAQSFRRKLDRKLVLLVKQRFPDQPSPDYVSPWILPRLAHSDSDTLRQTTEKCIRAVFPAIDKLPMGLKVLGNAPFSHHMQPYSKSMRERLGFDGSIIFFYPILMYQRQIAPLAMVDLRSDQVADFMWCTREELDASEMDRRFRRDFSFALVE